MSLSTKIDNYPEGHAVDLGISEEQWTEMWNDSKIFKKRSKELMLRIFNCYDHKTTCYDLGLAEGRHPSSYNSTIVHLGRRILHHLNLPPITVEDSKESWWRVVFWGRYLEDDHFEWKIKPNLISAISKSENISITAYHNEFLDKELVEDINRKFNNLNANDKSKTVSPKKKSCIKFANRKYYTRNRQVAMNALIDAGNVCEVNSKHKLFKRKNSNINYTEPHHLVPMAYSDDFGVSLDIEENIISLCSHCHNHLHYGRDIEGILQKLYDSRKELLSSAGISLSFDHLLSYYN